MEGTPYVFLDESGDFDFSSGGSRYFVLTSVTTLRPFTFDREMSDYRYALLEEGMDLERFHCVEDNRRIRENVFGTIVAAIDTLSIDCVIVDKAKTNPSLYEPRRFYPKMMGYLLKYVLRGMGSADARRAVVVTDRLPISKGKKIVEKAIREAVPETIAFCIRHHPSCAHFGLQVADYCCWAIQRKWERGDEQFYNRIRSGVRSEFDIFGAGSTRYY